MGDKAARQEIKAKMALLRREKDNLIDELEKERVDKLRLVKETERGTLECQVVEWTARAKTAEEKCKTISKASEEAIGKAREGERKARQDKNSFVIDLQRKMEIGGIQMYCIENSDWTSSFVQTPSLKEGSHRNFNFSILMSNIVIVLMGRVLSCLIMHNYVSWQHFENLSAIPVDCIPTILK